MGLAKPFFKDDEGGFTTIGVAIALLLALVLAFGAVQAQWTQARAGQIQYVADAAALASDGVVAEVVLYAQAIDAALLSFSLLGITTFAASAVAAFIPGGEAAAGKLAELGGKIFSARDKLAKTAKKGLDAVQKVMPLLCTLRAMEVIDANSRVSGIDYHGVAIPLPLQGEKLSLADDSEAEEKADEIVDKEDEVQEEVQKQKEAQEKMDAAKEQGWRADCGDSPSMRERADSLAGLSAADNPDYSSPETWSFSVALARAKKYYKARYDQEPGAGYEGTPEEVGESVARKAFYKYALATVSKGSVTTDQQGAERPDFKALAENVKEVSYTSLYRESVYPVCRKDGKRVLHAYVGCPGYKEGTADGVAAVSAIDDGSVEECPECKFSVTTLGRVPSPSTAISNGFEYHYKRVVEAASAYRSAAEEAAASTQELQENADEMSEDFHDAVKSLLDNRIDIKPAGRYGCICIVAAGESTADIGAAIIGGQSSVGARAAVSAATLAVDPSVDQTQALQGIAEGLVSQESLGSGLAKTVFGCWGSALSVYSQGADGLEGLIRGVLGAIPLVGTDLSSWVGDKFVDAVEDIGMEPAEVNAYKPVLVSSSTVLAQDDGAFSQALLKAQNAATAYQQASLGNVKGALETLDVADDLDLDLDESGSVILAVVSWAASGLGVGESVLAIPASGDLLQVFQSSFSYVRSALQ